ncbi:MAG: ATP-binding cassette domain-containing protein [Eubacterium sp.]|nr:ATP-binding cassette domain-containing protein [Eubacterium sp.]
MGEIITVKNLTFSYEGSDENALRDISFGVEPGEIVLLMGASGCGKSTLLRRLKGGNAPGDILSGEILFDGRPIGGFDRRELASRIGFVSQNPDDDIVTDRVYHELAFAPESLGMPRDAIRRAVSVTASAFGMEQWFEDRTDTLSGGQKQILSLASVMTLGPDLLILDEPLSMLDPTSARRFLDMLREINTEYGTAIIISEHSTNLICEYVHRIMFMDGGRIVADGDPRECAKAVFDMNHPMAGGFPAAAEIAYRLGERERLPMNVREGKAFVADLCAKKGIEPAGRSAAPGVPTAATSGVPTSAASGPGDSDGEILLSCENVYFRYTRDSRDILRGFTLDIRAGEVISLFGANAGGKSTALRILCGLDTPRDGVVRYLGKRIKKDGWKELYGGALGVLPQNPSLLFTERTLREELLVTASEEDADRLCGLFELTELMESHPDDLSAGQAQSLALAKIIALRPRVLLLDEPTKGMDVTRKAILADVLEGLKNSGVGILLITHDTEFSALCADRCAFMFGGGVVSVAKTGEFMSGGGFYSTAANRMAGGYFPGVLTAGEVAKCLM